MNTPTQVRTGERDEVGETDETRHPRHITWGERYLSLTELADYSGMSKKTLRRKMRDEGLPHYKLRDRVLVRRSEFDAWMLRYRRGTVPTHVQLFDD